MALVRLLMFAVAMAAAASLRAEPNAPLPFGGLSATSNATPTAFQMRLAYHLISLEEARKNGLPPELVDAVIAIESAYDASRIGSVGEIGLMQVRPGTAAMLGFKGSLQDLAAPATNVHYGATYLGQAWRLAKGDICRALMKYRAGHGEEVMTPLSSLYCARARAHLVAIGSPLAKTIVAAVVPEVMDSIERADALKPGASAAPRHALHGVAFWRAEQGRVRTLTARVEARWRRVASR